MKAMIKSTLSLFIAFILLFSVAYAWFTNTNRSHVSPVSYNVTQGVAYDYEIKYYTKDHVFKFDSQTQTLYVYNASSLSWVLPHELPELSNQVINGAIIGKYDALIPENNANNNVLIEINVNFTNSEPMTLAQTLKADTSFSSSIVSSLTLDTTRPYYVSEVAFVQNFLSSSYNSYDDTFNKYNVLTTEFNRKDGFNNFIYTKHSFYQNNIYQSSIFLGSDVFEPQSTLRYYYNISYDELRVSQIFNSEFQNTSYNITNIPTVLFFQDLYISILGGSN